MASPNEKEISKLDGVKAVDGPQAYQELLEKSLLDDNMIPELIGSYTESFYRFSLGKGVLKQFVDPNRKIYRLKVHLNDVSTSSVEGILSQIYKLEQKHSLDISIAGFITFRSFLFSNVYKDFLQSFGDWSSI